MIVQGQTTSFKQELYEGVHNFTTDTFKIALYTAYAALNQDTLVYTSDGEITGTGYTATGQVLLNPTVSSASGVAYISFDNPSWTSAHFTARGALIYKYDGSTNPAMIVLDFGNDKTSTGTFQVQFPTANNTNAIVRIS